MFQRCKCCNRQLTPEEREAKYAIDEKEGTILDKDLSDVTDPIVLEMIASCKKHDNFIGMCTTCVDDGELALDDKYVDSSTVSTEDQLFND